MTSDIESMLRNQADHLRQLQENWDDYGAQPVTNISLNAVLNDLDIESSNSCPCLIPAADGSVQAEWHVSGADIEYCVAADGTARSLSVRVNADEIDRLKAQNVQALELLEIERQTTDKIAASHDRLHEQLARAKEALKQAMSDMTCRNDASHYCPNCDCTTFDARVHLEHVLAELEK